MTPRQRAFCPAYVKCGSAIQAALDVGYTPQYADRKSHLLLKNPDVVAEIKRLRNRMNQMADKTATDVVNELATIAFSDRVGFLKPDPEKEGEWMNKSPEELDDAQRRIIEKVIIHNCEVTYVDADGRKESMWRQEYDYVFLDKAKALEQMGRHYGIFDDKLRLGVNTSNPFSQISQKQLELLQAAYIKTMNVGQSLIDGKTGAVVNGT